MTLPPKSETTKRAAAFALVMLALFLIITLLGVSRTNARRLDRALDQNRTLIDQADDVQRTLTRQAKRLGVLEEQNDTLIGQLRAAGIKPLTGPQERSKPAKAPTPQEREQRNQEDAAAPKRTTSDRQPAPAPPKRKAAPPKQQPDPPNDDDDDAPTNPIEEAVDDVGDTVCSILGC